MVDKEHSPDASAAPLFAVSNHHTAQAGRAPAIDGDRPGDYHGYFENRHGEQFVFVYRSDMGEGTLWGGDIGWEPHPVVDGKVESLILSREERSWLQACWDAATCA
jgi:hypothetical protein